MRQLPTDSSRLLNNLVYNQRRWQSAEVSKYYWKNARNKRLGDEPVSFSAVSKQGVYWHSTFVWLPSPLLFSLSFVGFQIWQIYLRAHLISVKKSLVVDQYNETERKGKQIIISTEVSDLDKAGSCSLTMVIYRLFITNAELYGVILNLPACPCEWASKYNVLWNQWNRVK